MIQAGFPQTKNGGLVFVFGADPQVTRQDGTLVVGVCITLKRGRDDDLIALVLSAKKLAPGPPGGDARRGGKRDVHPNRARSG